MSKGPLPAAQECCCGCDVEECKCNGPNGAQCFPVFQVKFSGIAHNMGGGCTLCDVLNNTWFEYDCATDGLTDGSAPYFYSPAENGLWFKIFTATDVDPCLSGNSTRNVWVKITRSAGTTVTINFVVESNRGTSWTYGLYEIAFTTSSSTACPDYSNKSEQTVTFTGGSNFGATCTFLSSSAVFRWV